MYCLGHHVHFLPDRKTAFDNDFILHFLVYIIKIRDTQCAVKKKSEISIKISHLWSQLFCTVTKLVKKFSTDPRTSWLHTDFDQRGTAYARMQYLQYCIHEPDCTFFIFHNLRFTKKSIDKAAAWHYSVI